jgi:phosphohistidine phosphatase SixA
VFSSPYRRALETTRIVLGELACDLEPTLAPELTPDRDPGDALQALLAGAPDDGLVLAVAHLPLLGRLAVAITGDPVDFLPGTLAEFELDAARRFGTLRRRLGPDEL